MAVIEHLPLALESQVTGNDVTNCLSFQSRHTMKDGRFIGGSCRFKSGRDHHFLRPNILGLNFT